jgi:hypothetical protein
MSSDESQSFFSMIRNLFTRKAGVPDTEKEKAKMAEITREYLSVSQKSEDVKTVDYCELCDKTYTEQFNKCNENCCNLDIARQESEVIQNLNKESNSSEVGGVETTVMSVVQHVVEVAVESTVVEPLVEPLVEPVTNLIPKSQLDNIDGLTELNIDEEKEYIWQLGSSRFNQPSAHYAIPKCDAPKCDCDAPECDAPECDAPECDAPECDAPECDAPEYDAPECDAPECDAPECDAPECDAPECDAPECDAPKDEILYDDENASEQSPYNSVTLTPNDDRSKSPDFVLPPSTEFKNS